MRAWPVARSIFDAPYVREANERTTSWIIFLQISGNNCEHISVHSRACGHVMVPAFFLARTNMGTVTINMAWHRPHARRKVVMLKLLLNAPV